MAFSSEPELEENNSHSSSFSGLVGYSKFVRSNPRSDRFPVHSFHHVEFWCSDATSAASRFSFGLGMPIRSRSDLSTGNSLHCSFLLRSHSLRFLFTAPYPSFIPNSNPSIPSFHPETSRSFVSHHGLAVRAVAVAVSSAEQAFNASVSNGAVAVFPPTDLGDGFSLAEVQLYGDVVLRFVTENPSSAHTFLPGFVDEPDPDLLDAADYGLRRLDHAVGNVESLAPALSYVARFTGFHEFAEFTADDVGTAESGLNSVVLANNSETVLLPLNEPVHGTKRRSQIQTYLDHNGGPGVQHLALSTDDVIGTLRKMRAVSRMGGFDFMPAPPPNYYDGVRRRAGDVLTEEQINACRELGILVDRDDQGVLMQIFTKPVGDRPTLFLEIIQRVGCMMKDETGKEYQKGGCGGFGKGNFSELFKSIEDYEKTLEAKQQPVAALVS
ncbi:putative 4-hydroxyphenylpyruvate dioxygenase [Iris pallida]|uniref:4-hydroxyphenylpyruvate dioxygenase n=1 Tax=Iris pallida TaxID=29817 RepID=A0AAX6GYV0_IRIPA|nr:putative 4-hydroxyphenylpyruvate dioxygenase [Iris pallida]